MENESTIEEAKKAFGDFFASVIRLRSPGGCPWDLEQTPKTMREALVEECFEAVDAINEEKSDHIQEELGDVLLNLVLIAFMHEQSGLFSLADIIHGINEKIIRRHPHVFSESEGKLLAKEGGAKTSEEVLEQWDTIKTGLEGRKTASILDEVSMGLPPLLRAYKLQKKAKKKGFDWDITNQVKEKVMEELQELEDAKTYDEREDEAGDVLFAMVNYIRHLDLNPSIALARANAKFYKRFLHVEKRMDEEIKNRKSSLENGKELSEKKIDLKELDEFWKEAKDMDAKGTLEYT